MYRRVSDRPLTTSCQMKFEVEFGLELALKSGKIISMLAEAGATASVKVTLAWKGDEDGDVLTPEARLDDGQSVNG